MADTTIRLERLFLIKMDLVNKKDIGENMVKVCKNMISMLMFVQFVLIGKSGCDGQSRLLKIRIMQQIIVSLDFKPR